MSGSKCKGSGHVADTSILFMVLYCEIKNFLFFVFLCIIHVKNVINLYAAAAAAKSLQLYGTI